MRPIIVTEFVTLDGVMQDPGSWQEGYRSPEAGRFKRQELFEISALLLGRVTYDEFVGYWPTASETGDFGERMNALPKLVATSQPGPLAWNAARLEGDVPEAVRALKRQDGGSLLTYGSGALVRTLLRHGLVDELRLMVYPIAAGRGRRLFGQDRVPLKLKDRREFAGGVLLLTYAPAAPDPAPNGG
ncbi:MAG TPA: dihydrofolate reductase family protein [Deinococcales bacterium]|nr:dihydrofolate reductase family protein [Deinococcales bacterium]